MGSERLFIVEDENIVAEDLRDMLTHLGYTVIGTASSGEEAIQKVEQLQPDLVLMDIRLNGEMDGIEAAETIWAHHAIPVTYLTAYADESTLERAKATMPFGYILKPFEERDLRSTIEIALYKHRMESTLKSMEGWYASALESLTEAVIATNPRGGIVFMNSVAEGLTGWTLRQAYGKSFRDTLCIQGPDNLQEAVKPEIRLSTPAGSRPMGTLKTKSGREIQVEFGSNTLKDDQGQLTGTVVILHPSAARQPETLKSAVSGG